MWRETNRDKLLDILYYAGLGGLLILYLWLILPGLGTPAYWGDEAGNSLVAKTIMKHGVPLAYYGVHPVEDYYYSANSLGLEAAHGWLAFYLPALSFALFGESELAGRVPFMLCGGAAVLVLAFVGRLLYGRFIGLLAGLLLTLQPRFLQYCRQNRYYALVLLFTGVTLACYLLVRRGRWRWATLSVASLFTFHSSQYFAGVLYPAVFVVDMIKSFWDKWRGVPYSGFVPWRKVVLGSLALILPWVLFFSFGRSMTDEMTYDYAKIPEHAMIVVRDSWNYFPYLILFGLVPVAVRRRSYFPAGLALVTLAAIILIPDKIYLPGAGLHRRYILHMLPLGALISARGLALFAEKRFWPFLPALLLIGSLQWTPGLHSLQDIYHFDLRDNVEYYSHPRNPDPERLAAATIHNLAQRYSTFLISTTYRWQVYAILGPEKTFTNYCLQPARPDKAYAIVMNQRDFDFGYDQKYRYLLDGCRQTIYRDRSLLGINWAEGPLFANANATFTMGVWECPAR